VLLAEEISYIVSL